METRLKQLTQQRLDKREASRDSMRAELRAALAEADAFPAFVFGSITQLGRFHEESDVDVAMAHLPGDWTLYGLTGWLAEKLGRRVDIVLLPECRFRHKIEREGELWTR